LTTNSDSGTPADKTLRCGYCDSPDLAYELDSDKGPVVRCIPCLAIEQGQQGFSLPFEAWLDRDMIEPPEAEDAPDFEPFDPREANYESARSWFQILARIQQDDPLVKRDPDDFGTIREETREFLVNFMGADAHKPPSELVGEPAKVGQTALDGGDR